jgi:hypothetical protein
VFLINTRRTGIDAATMVIAVSAVARIMILTVATLGFISTGIVKKNKGFHILVSGSLIPDKVAVLAIDVTPALYKSISCLSRQEGI